MVRNEASRYQSSETAEQADTRLNLALSTLGYDEVEPRRNWERAELVTAIRKFAVMAPDWDLEAACDRKLGTIPGVKLVDGRLIALSTS